MIRGRKRPLEKAPEVNANLNCSIHNRFDIEVIDAATGKIKQMAQAENVICNTLWTKLLTPCYVFQLHPLRYRLWHSGCRKYQLVYFPWTWHSDDGRRCLFPQYKHGRSVAPQENHIIRNYGGGVYADRSWNRIQYHCGHAVTHAMLKDMNGNQISIIKTNTDIINIYATVFAHWNTSGENSGYIHVIPHLLQTGTAQGFFRMILGMYEATYSTHLMPPSLLTDVSLLKHRRSQLSTFHEHIPRQISRLRVL